MKFWRSEGNAVGARVAEPTTHRRRSILLRFSIIACLSGAAGNLLPLSGASRRSVASDNISERVTQKCGQNPEVVFARAAGVDPDGIAVALASDTENERADGTYSNLVALARMPEVGTVHGVAYDSRRRVAYVSAVVQEDRLLGPLGLGGIYRIHVPGGRVDPWTSIAAGTLDDSARPLEGDVGRRGLGDIDIDTDNNLVFVANAFARTVHVISTDDASEVAVIPSGAVAEPWADDSILFGLGVRGDFVYQGVVDSGYRFAEAGGPIRGYVYQSRFDGAEVKRVASFDLDYPRTPRWRTWGFVNSSQDPHGRGTSFPIVADIDFDIAGNMLIGLMDVKYYRKSDQLSASGDVLRLTRQSDTLWVIEDSFDFLDDDLIVDGGVVASEINIGPLAVLPSIGSLVVAGGFLPAPGQPGFAEALKWYDLESGEIRGPSDGKEWVSNDDERTGDIELACTLEMPPTPTPTSTVHPSPTSTPATPTSTSSVTPTVTQGRFRVYLPVALANGCHIKGTGVDVVLVLDLSTSMLRQTESGQSKLMELQDSVMQFVEALDSPESPAADRIRLAIVGFNDQSWVEQDLTGDADALESAIARLPGRVREGTRLDLALASGAEVLATSALDHFRQRSLVLFTDGLPNTVPTPVAGGSQEDTVLAQALRAKAEDITIFTIGFGRRAAQEESDRINDQLLQSIASSSRHYFETQSGAELRRIYLDIAREVRCPF